MKRGMLSLVFAGLVALSLGLASNSGSTAEAAPAGAARNLRVNNISANQASFRWRPSGWGYTQWVDISHWNGFYWQWQNGGPLSGSDNDYTWSGLLSNTTYYVRINTGIWTGDWLASDWEHFDTPPGVINCYGGGPGPYPQPGVYVVPGIQPCQQQPSVRIWTDRGDGATYRINESIRVCYSVSAPMYIQIVDVMANGVQQTFTQGYDDGRGDCLPARVTPPQGLERIYIYGQGGVSASTYFHVR